MQTADLSNILKVVGPLVTTITPQILLNLFDFRLAIEPYGAAQAAKLATLACGITPQPRLGGCTNSNMPIAIGIPAVTLGRGGAEYGTHTVDEWFDPAGVYVCEQKSLLLLLALAGLTDVTAAPQL